MSRGLGPRYALISWLPPLDPAGAPVWACAWRCQLCRCGYRQGVQAGEVAFAGAEFGDGGNGVDVFGFGLP